MAVEYWEREEAREGSDFNKVCNMLSEYGSGKPFSLAGEAHLIEHADCILSGHALEQLADL